MNNKKTLYIISIIILLITLIICSLIGVANISFMDATKIILKRLLHLNIDTHLIPDSSDIIIWQIRFPRVLVGALVGGSLSVAGASYQGLLKNPMADPYIIGVSSGAALGASIGIISKISFSFLGLTFTSLMAFSFAIITVTMVYNIARVGNKVPMTTLLLSGVAIGQFLTAFTSIIMVFAYSDMRKIMLWTMGSLSGKGWEQFTAILPYTIIGVSIIYYYANDLNIFLLGEDTAKNLGVNVEKTKKILLIVSAMLTASAVSVSGIIGFIGLVVPHMVRIITGPDHKVLVPMSFIVGAFLMVVCDTLARSLISLEIPVGIITAILGGPFFIYLLRSSRKESF